MGKPVVPDGLAEPQTAQLSVEKSLLASPAHAVKKGVCVLCSEATDELICGACHGGGSGAQEMGRERWALNRLADAAFPMQGVGKTAVFQLILGRGDWRKPKR
jgi:hypothetical protein